MPRASVNAWYDFMPDEVTFYARTGRSVSNVPVYSPTATTVKARIEMKNRLIVTADGKQITSRGRVFLGTTTAPNVEDKIVLPSGFSPVSPPMLAVNLISDENGAHHVTVEIG